MNAHLKSSGSTTKQLVIDDDLTSTQGLGMDAVSRISYYKHADSLVKFNKETDSSDSIPLGDATLSTRSLGLLDAKCATEFGDGISEWDIMGRAAQMPRDTLYGFVASMMINLGRMQDIEASTNAISFAQYARISQLQTVVSHVSVSDEFMQPSYSPKQHTMGIGSGILWAWDELFGDSEHDE